MQSKKNVAGFSAIVLIIIIVAIVLSLVAVFAVKNMKTQVLPQASPQALQDSQVQALENQSTSDVVGAIDKDVNNTNLDNLDQGLDQVDKNLPGVN